MRSAEITLFLIPFALFAAWRISVAYARPSVVWARIEAGKIVPGQGVPR
jgi:hypothetical protein